MAFVFDDRVRVNTSTTGTGSIAVGSAVLGYRTPATAGVANGDTFHYAIEDAAGAWETGLGTYSTTGPTIARTLIESSTGSLLSLSGTAQIFITLLSVYVLRLMLNDTEDQLISGGARVTVKSLGNLSGASITPDPGDRPIQSITNNGAGSVLPGTNYGTYLLQIINASGAGAITSTGWTLKGDAFDTTTTSKFLCSCVVTANLSLMSVIKVA